MGACGYQCVEKTEVWSTGRRYLAEARGRVCPIGLWVLVESVGYS